MAEGDWILRGSFYATRWREWLDRRSAPCLSVWADSRDERDTRRDCASVAYWVPLKMPPPDGDDQALGEVYDYIRFRLDAGATPAKN